MTRKKSRPTHRENSAAVPSNEGGFYKMFWNSMDTQPGTNGPNSPSQGDPPVVIISDSEGSPCGHDENSCENLVVPLPIKEEISEDAVNTSNQHFPVETSSNTPESQSVVSNGEFPPFQTCLPCNIMQSPSKNISPAPPLLDSSSNKLEPSQTCKNPSPISPCVISVSETSSHEPSSEISSTPNQSQDIHSIAEKDGDPKVVEHNQVCNDVTAEDHVEMLTESNVSQVENSNVTEVTSFENYVMSSMPQTVGDNSTSTPVFNEEISHFSPNPEVIPPETPSHIQDPPEESFPALELQTAEENPENNLPDELPSNPVIPHEAERTPMESESEFQTLAVDQVNHEILNEPPSLSLLRSLLNRPDEDLDDLNLAEALAEWPGFGERNDPDPNTEGEMVCFESEQENNLPGNVDVSNMDVDPNTALSENIPLNVESMTPDAFHQKQINEVIEDEPDEFPTFNHFLPKKIKLDTVGILRSVKVLKDSVLSLYKEYLKDDVILRTHSATPELPAEAGDDSADEIEETPCMTHIDVRPKICCVKVERLPDPFVKKTTVTMSDDTFKTWKRQIIRQRNEEKFLHLKVWRRGRTLLWRECELAGMDRATYDEQVAYVKKHKLIESSSSDSDDDESVAGASSHKFDSSEESYSDLENEDSEGELSLPSLSSPSKHSETQPHIATETSTDTRLSEDEYVVERAKQSSETRTPSALKITIRKASTSKSEDDKEKADEEGSFPVPFQPSGKSRKIATKRTYRRPSDPITPKASVAPKSTSVDSKKSKSTPLEDEYDQSLLGTRSYEVENFNLLEKWDIPFEEPTLFRSPRAASRLAQLKTKEAFQTLKRHGPLKPATTTTSSGDAITTSTTTTTDSTTVTVSKAVKDVVEMLCSKTIEAVLFPESKSAGTKKLTKTDINSIEVKDSTTHIQPNERTSKLSTPSEESSSIFDESSEFSQSETNSTLDASSDFGGSTASLVSEDFHPPKNKSPQKRRRRPRFGPGWGKKKKVKSKPSKELHVEKEPSEKDETPVHSTEMPVVEKAIQETGKSTQEVGATVHPTQVPVVSEGLGQSPCESEDDSSHRLKEPLVQNDVNNIIEDPAKKILPKDAARPSGLVEPEELPSEGTKPTKKVVADVVLTRLTRSKQPTVELDPDLLENIGARRRKKKSDVVEDVSPGEDSKVSKPDVTKKTPQKSKAQSHKASAAVKGASSTSEKIVNGDLNTQVPEVSEGTGDVGLDHENKQDQLNEVETVEPTVRMLRSRSRGPGPHSTKRPISPPVKHSADDNKKTITPEEADKPADKQLEEPLVLESPASPPPETVEVEPLVNGRITRSKRRSGPAYVAVKSSVANALPSVGDIVDSIAGTKLPTPSKLFDASAPVTSSLITDSIIALRVQTSSIDHTPITEGKVLTRSSNELGQKPSRIPDDISVPTTIEGTSQWSSIGQSAELAEPVSSNIIPAPLSTNSGSYSVVPELKSATETPSVVAGQTSEQSNNLIDGDVPGILTETIPPAAAVEGVISETARTSSGLALEKPGTDNVECGRLEVLDTLNSILAVTSPKKASCPVSSTSPLLPPPLRSKLKNTASTSQPLLNSISTPTANSASLPGYLNSTQDINSILPGTFLNSFLNSSLEANLTTYSNEVNDSTSLADDPDGDLVIDEGEVPDVNFWENLTNADLDKNDNSGDFSDDENNTDLADKIDKIVKDQIHQDPVPVPSLNVKGAGVDDGNKETSPSKSVLNRRDSIDERTGLPTNFIQRLRDPRIRSRLLSQLEEEEATGKTQSLAPLLNCLASNTTSSTAPAGNSNPQKKPDGVAVSGSSSVINDSSLYSVPAILPVATQPVLGSQFETIGSAVPGQPSPVVMPNAPPVATPLVPSGTQGHLPHAPQDTPLVEDTNKPEEPPDPSKVDFVVPPSDDEEGEEESLKRRPKKAKKQVDAELMYKSPLEDLQSEARPGYGERGSRRYADKYPRRRSGDDRSRWDDRRSREDQRFEERGRSRSRDRRFEERARSRSRDGRFDDRRRDRSRSRDRRGYYDHPRDRRAYDPYPGREDPETTPHHLEMQVPYNQSPWPVSPAFHHHQMMMPSPRWQPNYYPEPPAPHPPIFLPDPPKIDFMETRLINLELLPKTTNLEISPIRKVFSYFDKDSVQVMKIPPPTYDPNEHPRTIKMMDPVSEEMVDFIQTPRPTGGLTKDIFSHVPPDLTLDDVVQFHFITPSYVMVVDNEEDPSSSSDEEEDKQEVNQSISHNFEQVNKPPQQRKRVNKPMIEPPQKRQCKPADETFQKQVCEPSLGHHSKGEIKSNAGNLSQGSAPKVVREDTPLQNLLQNLPLLQQFSLQQFQLPIPPPPPAPEWNDVDLRMSRELAEEENSAFAKRNSSPPKERSRKRSRSRSKSPVSARHSSPHAIPTSPRSRSRSKSPRSISRSRSKSPRSTSHRSRSKSPKSTRLRSKSPKKSSSRRSRSKSPRSTSRRSRSKSPRSTSFRSKSPKKSSRRSRSKSPRSTSLRSKSPKKSNRRSRSKSPRKARRRRHRSRSRSSSRSDVSLSTSRSRSRSSSPAYSRRGSRTSRRRRSRSTSSERSRSSWSRRSRSPKRHSTSISPSRKHRR